uniref:Uncharacterized protein n=1 Tax=Sphaerodactylus townsendi TaxID=933632 RepID=A0ACB8ET00_9SAUR
MGLGGVVSVLCGTVLSPKSGPQILGGGLLSPIQFSQHETVREIYIYSEDHIYPKEYMNFHNCSEMCCLYHLRFACSEILHFFCTPTETWFSILLLLCCKDAIKNKT